MTLIFSPLSRAIGGILLSVSLIGCANQTTTSEETASSGFPMMIENCGRQVTIEAPPERLYVIGGEAGTLIHSAGGSDKINTFSPLVGEPLGEAEEVLGEKKQLPIHTASEMSREVIIGESPDLVVAFGLSGFEPEDLEAAGIPTYVINGYCGGFGAGQSTIENPLEGIYEDVATLGTILGTEDIANAAVADMKARVEKVKQRAQQASTDDTKVAALFVAGGGGGIGAYGNRSMIHQQMEYVGLTNVFEETSERYFEPSIESFIDAAPERIIALHEPADITEESVQSVLTERPDIASVPAIMNNQIDALNFFYSGHGSLAIEGLEMLSNLVNESSDTEDGSSQEESSVGK
ncbi:ABC transporter substrate-binding protein [Aureibacillus halotolerans]|uniref:ABC-type Fe3+-hydroxamate transport system substrate-binding protein n=1 Tax=Aureibacillus halotolerans TaxID=1508390 RepID=A0A4R6U3U2_9BACI|nr:ABC transporter substrate-binding protein [Aureibacillus halotolerans]TDQ41158.1 ABC-type Fe3+-hydroxamate transport system substrate-binding protein [Aureibacillus halotolerans]